MGVVVARTVNVNGGVRLNLNDGTTYLTERIILGANGRRELWVTPWNGEPYLGRYSGQLSKLGLLISILPQPTQQAVVNAANAVRDEFQDRVNLFEWAIDSSAATKRVKTFPTAIDPILEDDERLLAIINGQKMVPSWRFDVTRHWKIAGSSNVPVL